MAQGDPKPASRQTRRRETDQPESVPALAAPPIERDNPLTRSLAGVLGIVFLTMMIAACVGSLPWTLGAPSGSDVPRYSAGAPSAGRISPAWWPPDEREKERLNALVPEDFVTEVAAANGITFAEALAQTEGPVYAALAERHPRFVLGSDLLGRSVLVRALTGGGISLGIGIAAAVISVTIGTVYGAVAGYAGGKVDGLMMRIVDVLYGLPYILLVVLIAVAVDGFIDDRVAAGLELSTSQRTALDIAALLIAIGGVSWLTMARVVRGQVLSLKNQPFVEAARAVGAPTSRIFVKHLLPNLVGPITVYATLTVPQAILQESFLSFLGIGVKPPLPSWGNLAAEGLSELNTFRSHWWLLAVPSALLGVTLLALNFVGEGLREALDPKRARR
ncbi:MAG: ABC transporter permease [Planctomycetota bacterium]